MSIKPTIVWFRQDLRLEDQLALTAAIAKGGAVIPLFIWAPEEEGEWAPGAASRWWLHGALESLQADLAQLGLPLIIRQSPSLETLQKLIQQTGADAVFWNRRFEPLIVQRDAKIKAQLQTEGIGCEIFNATLLFDPWKILTKQRKPYQVFTPFWKTCCLQGEPELPLRLPPNAIAYRKQIPSDEISDLKLLPTIPWDKGIKRQWQPGAKGAKKKLQQALKNVISDYEERRNFPALPGTSELSPYLHHGEISVRQLWHAVRKKFGFEKEANVYLRQLGWRDFAYYLLVHFPSTPNKPLHKQYAHFPWKYDAQALKAWQKGLTGYPIVDAGMRQLWQIGWMHNRVRMIVGSFLVKDLLLHWLEGAKWFWDTLVDADLANNTLGWQWIGGCGADAAPYFRIFNPISQGQKFDGEGEYVRRWIPELASLPNRWIHCPWEAPPDVLKAASIVLGETYPKPIVEHAEARKLALEAYEKIRSL